MPAVWQSCRQKASAANPATLPLVSPEVEILPGLVSKVVFTIWDGEEAQECILGSLSIELDLPMVG